MKKLLTGVERFRSEVLDEQQEFYEQLGHGQAPQAVFITCSDSRIDPNRLTQTEPGELFIVRNAGNIVPAWGSGRTSEAGTLEYAVQVLGVQHIIVCGHSDCGAVKALIGEQLPEDLPALCDWLHHADCTRHVVRECYAHLEPEEKLSVAIQENVLTSLASLRTHPAIAAKLAAGKIHLHAWVYKITTGEVFAHDAGEGQFIPLRHAELPGSEKRELEDVF